MEATSTEIMPSRLFFTILVNSSAYSNIFEATLSDSVYFVSAACFSSRRGDLAASSGSTDSDGGLWLFVATNKNTKLCKKNL